MTDSCDQHCDSKSLFDLEYQAVIANYQFKAAIAEYRSELQNNFTEYLGLTIESARAKYDGPIHVDVKEGVGKSCPLNLCKTRMHVKITNGVISKIYGLDNLYF